MKIQIVALFFSLLVSSGQAFSNDPQLDLVKIVDVEGDNNLDKWWFDSYSVGDNCYCDTTWDHGIGEVLYDTGYPQLGNNGVMNVRDICALFGPGPGRDGRPTYNDIQCGNGPINNHDISDEVTCPGRTELGVAYCGYIGPKWNFESLPGVGPTASPTISPAPTAASDRFSIRINAGSTEGGIDSNGNIWVADIYGKNGWSASKDNGIIKNALPSQDEFIFRTGQHTGGSGLQYEIPVPDGNWKFTFYYMEFWHSDRRFDLVVEGEPFDDLSFVEEAGGTMTAYKREFDNIVVNDGFLSIELYKVNRGGFINGIEITPGTSESSKSPTVSPTASPIGPPTTSPTGTPTAAPVPCMEFLVVNDVSTEWMSVSLSRSYDSAIPVCSLLSGEEIIRIQNIGLDSFDVKIDNIVSGADVYCHVFEEGSCTLPDGRNLDISSN